MFRLTECDPGTAQAAGPACESWLNIVTDAGGAVIGVRLGSSPIFPSWSFLYRFRLSELDEREYRRIGAPGVSLSVKIDKIFAANEKEVSVNDLNIDQLRGLLQHMGYFSRDRPHGPQPGLHWAGIHVTYWLAAADRLKQLSEK